MPSPRTASRSSGSAISGAESAELASMCMELLAAPHLGPPGGLASAERDSGWRGSSTSRTCSSTPGARRLGRRLPELDLHQRGRAAMRRRATRPGSGSGAAFEQGVDWCGPRRTSGWRAGTDSCTSSCTRSTTSSTAWRSSGRCRSGATEPDRPGGARSGDYREALALGCTVPLPADVRRRRGAQFGADRALIGELVGDGGGGTRAPAGGVSPGCLMAAAGQDSPRRPAPAPRPAAACPYVEWPGWRKKKASRWKGW